MPTLVILSRIVSRESKMSAEIKTNRFLNHSMGRAQESTFSQNAQTTISSNNSFIKYSREIYNIHVDIIQNLLDHSYSALFRKNSEIYIPKEAPFHTNQLDLLFENIAIEMRSLAFTEFLGILLKAKIYKKVKQETLGFIQ